MNKKHFLQIATVFAVVVALAGCTLFGLSLKGTKWENSKTEGDITYTLTLDFPKKDSGTMVASSNKPGAESETYAFTYTFENKVATLIFTDPDSGKSTSSKLQLDGNTLTEIPDGTESEGYQPLVFTKVK